MSFGITVTRFACIVQRYASSKNLTMKASAASWSAHMAWDWNRSPGLNSCAISCHGCVVESVCAGELYVCMFTSHSGYGGHGGHWTGTCLHQSLKRQLPKQQLSGLLVSPDLPQRNSPRAVPVRLLHPTRGRRGLSDRLARRDAPKRDAMGASADCLLCSCHGWLVVVVVMAEWWLWWLFYSVGSFV